MAYLVTQLIARSWYLSGIVSRRLQTVIGDQFTEGFQLLNALLAVKSFDKSLIPYYTKTTFNAVIGQEEYFIENLIGIETETFNLGTVRFGMTEETRTRYFAYPRVDNILSLPFMWHLEREKGGARLYIYFKPKEAYPITFVGKYGFLSVTINQDLQTVFDDFYIEYLRYALAEYMCSDYGITLQPQINQKLNEYEKKLKYVSPIDFSNNVRSTLVRAYPDMYAQANLGRGWTT